MPSRSSSTSSDTKSHQSSTNTSRSSNTSYSSNSRNNYSFNSRNTNPRSPFNLKLASPFERCVNVWVTDGDSEPEPVIKRFPLSVLLKYSARSKKEIGENWRVGATGPRHIDWTIDIPKENVHDAVEARGLTEVLKWILDTQPAKGYAKTYFGHQQFPEDRLRSLSLEAHLYVYKAFFQLDLEAPLDYQGLRNIIKTQISDINNPISPYNLELIYDLLHNDDMGLFTVALARHVEAFYGVDYESEEYSEFNQLYESAIDEIQSMWDNLVQKLDDRKKREA